MIKRAQTPEFAADQNGEADKPAIPNGFSIEDLNPQNPDSEANHERMRQILIRFFKNNTLYHEHAEDLAQEVLLKAWLNRDQFDNRSSLMTWVHRIARNYSFGVHRHNRHSDKNPNLTDSLETVLKTHSAEDNLEEQLIYRGKVRGLREAAEVAFSRFPSSYKEAWDLRINKGMNVKDIAESLNIPEGTVKSRISRITEEIRNIMAGRQTVKKSNEQTAKSNKKPEKQAVTIEGQEPKPILPDEQIKSPEMEEEVSVDDLIRRKKAIMPEKDFVKAAQSLRALAERRAAYLYYLQSLQLEEVNNNFPGLSTKEFNGLMSRMRQHLIEALEDL